MAIEDLSDGVFDAIRTYLESAWTHSSIAWPNEHLAKPSAGWLQIEMTGTLYGQESIGAETQAANRWDEDGLLWGHVFVKAGTGSTAARGAARAFADLFRGTMLMSDALEFLDAQIGLGEPGDDDGNWFRISVSIGWRHIDA